MSGLTHAEAIRIAAEKFRDAGIDDPRAEARKVLLWATGMSAAELISAELQPLEFRHQAGWQMAVRHREARKPYQHLAGRTNFYGLDLRTDGRALIPRADSECVVDLALEHLPTGPDTQIADLGTGSGCLLLAVLSKVANGKGIGLDASADAISLAQENAVEAGVANRATFIASSWSDWTGWGDCDLIISNPPYICTDIISTLEPEVRDHDPLEALDGGEDGLDAYREIISLGAAQMKSGAHLVLEIGFDQKDSVSALLDSAGFVGLTHRHDLPGNDRAIAASKP